MDQSGSVGIPYLSGSVASRGCSGHMLTTGNAFRLHLGRPGKMCPRILREAVRVAARPLQRGAPEADCGSCALWRPCAAVWLFTRTRNGRTRLAMTSAWPARSIETTSGNSPANRTLSGAPAEMIMECAPHANSLLLALGCSGVENLSVAFRRQPITERHCSTSNLSAGRIRTGGWTCTTTLNNAPTSLAPRRTP